MYDIYELLKNEANNRNIHTELTNDKPDPLMVAKKYKDEYISLVCALFSYGNAGQIVKFLNTLDFTLLDKDNTTIEKKLDKHYYRFQSSKDVIEFFKTISVLKTKYSLENVFMQGYTIDYNIMNGLKKLISLIYDINPYRSRGYEFLIGKIPDNIITSPYKRWHMYLRWMVRNDKLDLGLWGKVRTKDLLVPLDTHTFKIGQTLGLISRKSYDFKAVLELTDSLKKIDSNDPVKYDFALYRIGQEKIISTD